MAGRVVNTVVRGILCSPAHRLLSGTVLLLTYTGKVSDRSFTVPVMYAGHNGEMLVYVGNHEHKKWWRNLRGGAPVHVRLRGVEFAGSACVIGGEPDVQARYVKRFPHAVRALDADREPVFVRIEHLMPV